MMRKIFHCGDSRVSFGMDVDGEDVTIAFAFCNPRDRFTRKMANTILNARLDHSGFSRNVFHLKSHDPIDLFSNLIKVCYALSDKKADRVRVDALKQTLGILAGVGVGVCPAGLFDW